MIAPPVDRNVPRARRMFMSERRIPDPTLMARLQLSVKGVDWAASLVQPWQHVEPAPGEWTAHRHVFHLLATEEHVFQPRVTRALTEDSPVFGRWDADAHFAAGYEPDVDIETLAAEFMAARAKTYEMFRALEPQQWSRTGVWTDGRTVDVAWIAERALWHALDHFATLLNLHGRFAPLQGR
jgi:hypothetical protein